MKQVVVIHGGNAYLSYEEYLRDLVAQVLRFDWLVGLDWKGALGENLGEGYQVIAPRMPNPQNAKYLEWKIWFEKFIPHLKDGVILVGHSLGGVFLAKYLSEEMFPKHVAATFLVAACYDEDGARLLPEFAITGSLKNFEVQGGKIFLYHSQDDPVVGFAELQKYRSALPSATVRTFTDRQHFNQESFPELLADIRSL